MYVNWIQLFAIHGRFHGLTQFLCEFVSSVLTSSVPGLSGLVIVILPAPHQLVALIASVWPRRSTNGVDCRRSYGIGIHLR